MNGLFVFRIASFDGIVIIGEVSSIIFHGGCNCVLLRSDCLEIHDNLMAVREILRFFKSNHEVSSHEASINVFRDSTSTGYKINRGGCLGMPYILRQFGTLVPKSLGNFARGYLPKRGEVEFPMTPEVPQCINKLSAENKSKTVSVLLAVIIALTAAVPFLQLGHGKSIN